jgi:uncharacterized membrane protein YfcA
MLFIYFFIGFIATLFGSLVGLGGGVIIKPALDTLNHFDATTISVLSSVTVFSMTIVSLFINMKMGIVIKKQLLWIASGGVIGGLIGKVLFSKFIQIIGNDDVSKGIQSLLLAFILAIVIYLVNHIKIKEEDPKPIITILAGVFLGTLSSFLGIGGGPLNVSLLLLLGGMDRKYAAFGSLFLIFASQGTKLITLTVLQEWGALDLKMLIVLIPGGVLGGYFGSKLYKRVKEGYLIIIFNIAVVLITCLNIFNAIEFLSN